MRNKATKQNMNLDLRRYGRNMYTKAENSGGSGGGEGGESSDSIIEAIKNLHVYLTEDGAKKVTNSGTLNYDQGQKDSFLSYGDPPINGVSVPIEDYLYVSDMNALKALIEILLVHSGYNSNNQYCVYDKTKHTPYLDIYNSTENADCTVIQRPIYQQEEPYDFIGDYVYIYYGEYGPNSMTYPNIALWIDPNDYTKALVNSEDL